MHPGSFGGICIHCGQKVDGESGVSFGYIHKVKIVCNDYLGDTNKIDLDGYCCRISEWLLDQVEIFVKKQIPDSVIMPNKYSTTYVGYISIHLNGWLSTAIGSVGLRSQVYK